MSNNSNTKTNTVTRHKRVDCDHVDGLAIQSTTYKTDETHGSIEHSRSKLCGDYVNVYVHANTGKWYEDDTDKVPTMRANYLEGTHGVSIGVGMNVTAFVSIEQAQELFELLEKALDDSTLGET